MKRILSVLLALVMVIGMLPMSILSASAATTKVVFELGADGNASHSDSSSAKTTYSETVGQYTLSLADASGMYPSSRDAKGNGCIKLGAKSSAGKFSFTVPSDVTSVVIAIAKYKANTTKVDVNGTTYTLTNSSNDGVYDEITVDTSSTKTVSVTTVSGGYRAMMNSITFVVESSGETEPACDHNYTSEVTAATCTEAGKTVYTCSLCGDSYEESIPATGHNFDGNTCTGCDLVKLDLEKADTIAVGNVVVFVCEAKTVELNGFYDTSYAIGTAYTDAPIGLYSWTVAAGASEGTYAFVNSDGKYLAWSSGNSAETSTDLNANSSWVVTFDENGNALVANAADNTRLLQWNASSPRFACYALKDGAMTQTAIQIYAVPCEHAYTSVVTEPTCDEDGFTTHTCSKCGDSYTDNVVEATGHSFENGSCSVCGEADPNVCPHTNQSTTTVDATCTEAGSVTVTCDACSETISTEVIEALGHTEVADAAVDATCTDTGLTAGSHCSVCNEVLVAQTVTEALGHNYVNGTCSVCNEAEPAKPTTITFELGADGGTAHADGSAADTYSETVEGYTLNITTTDTGKMYTGAVDATGNGCIKLGTGSVVGGFSFIAPDDVVTVVIRVAGYKTKTSKVDVNGTQYTMTGSSDNGVYDEITVDTSTQKTVTVETVSGASRVMVNSITFIRNTDSEADHTCVWDEGTVTKSATCLEEGVMTYSCTVDGCDKIKTEAIAKTAHNMTDGVCSVCGAEYYTLSTTLNNNDSVIIYYSSSKVALSATVSGSGLAGASVVIDESGMLTNSDVAIMKAQYVEGSTTDFYLICDGKYLTSGATGKSLSFAAEASDYAVWYIEIVDGGDNTVYIHNRNAAFNGSSQSLEFYSGFTTYSTKTTDIYKFQLYTKGENAIACEHEWSDWETVTDADCTTAGEQKSTCAKCGQEKTQTIAATGHTYVFGDAAVTCEACDFNVAKSEIGNVPKAADANVYYVEGVVTFVDGGTVYIQDVTAGITLRLANSVSAPKIGDKVEGIGTCSSYNGLIQLQDAYFETVSSDNTVEAQEVTLAEMVGDTTMSYQAKKVSMKGLTITLVGEYNATYKNVDYTVTDGTNSFLLYRTPAATQDDVLVLGDVINVVGVVGYYNKYQLRVVDANDITVVPSVKLTHISLKPGADALGFKAAATNMPEGAEIGIRMWVSEDKVITNTIAKDTISLRLQNIMAANGGETEIHAQAVIVLDGEVIAESEEVTTSMRQVIEHLNDNWESLDDDQNDAIIAYIEANKDVMKNWNVNSFVTFPTEE